MHVPELLLNLFLDLLFYPLLKPPLLLALTQIFFIQFILADALPNLFLNIFVGCVLVLKIKRVNRRVIPDGMHCPTVVANLLCYLLFLLLYLKHIANCVRLIPLLTLFDLIDQQTFLDDSTFLIAAYQFSFHILLKLRTLDVMVNYRKNKMYLFRFECNGVKRVLYFDMQHSRLWIKVNVSY